ncbi:spinster family MFS transporter [Glacieibacterium sp.]|uniref:spinster family MFS transporter n=1 Tax=Glacieibacterium sp. TaxID=2860237 RepID=UPI003AFFAF1D
MTADRADSYPTPARGYYVTGVLLLAYTLSYVDRQILSLMVEPVKRDLMLSDTQISLLHGFAFAIFYTLVGLFLGRAADRFNRRTLIIVGIAVWSAATAACGFAGSLAGLFLARMMVGFGEASLSPAAYSMLADYFPRERRGRALGIYSLGVYLGSGLAFIVGGFVIASTKGVDLVTLPLLGDFRPWQLAFLLVALPGLVLVPLMLTVREPVRRELAGGEAGLGHFTANRSFYLPAILGYAVLAIVTFAYTSWFPTAVIRLWGWSVRDIGIAYGVIMLVFGTSGMLLSGFAADKLVARGRADAHLWLSIFGTVAAIPSAIGAGLVSTPYAALAGVALTSFFISMSIALAPVVLQRVTPNGLRGQMTALYLLLINLVGMGMGPTLVALCTDFVFHDELAVRKSITVVTAVAATGSALLLWRSLRPYRLMLARIDGQERA